LGTTKIPDRNLTNLTNYWRRSAGHRQRISARTGNFSSDEALVGKNGFAPYYEIDWSKPELQAGTILAAAKGLIAGTKAGHAAKRQEIHE
jgi:hypothetical protein